MSDLKERYLAATAKRKPLHAKVVKHDRDEDWDPYIEACDEVTLIRREIVELAELAGFVVSLPLHGSGFLAVSNPPQMVKRAA